MTYTKEAEAEALRVLAARQEAALAESERRKKELAAKLPRTVLIDREIVSLGRALITAPEAEKEKIRKDILNLRAEKCECMVEAGFPRDYLEPPYTCKRCGDTGKENGKPCRCFAALLKKQAFDKSNLGSAFARMTFDNFDLSYYSDEKVGGRSPREQMEFVLKNCRAFAEKFEKMPLGLFLCGGTGLGKTHLSGAIARAVNDRGFSVCYETAPALFLAMEDRKFGRSTDGGRRVAEYFSADLLVLDDLGSEADTALSESNLLYLLNDRAMHGKRTVITANLLPQDMEARYDGRIFSRLVGDFKPLLFAGSDIRAVKAKGQ